MHWRENMLNIHKFHSHPETLADYDKSKFQDMEPVEVTSNQSVQEKSTEKSFKNLLVGSNPVAQEALDNFFNTIEGQEESILWYPSSGYDYRDVVEMHPNRRKLSGITQAPNIICHTDYNHEWTHFNKEIESGALLVNNRKTTIKFLEKHQLQFSNSADVVYRYVKDGTFRSGYRRNYGPAFEPMPAKPIIYLVKIEIHSKTEDVTAEAYIFFFIFENYHFLEEVVLRHKLKITHFVKVRQGCGFGGCKKCISVFYSLLGNIGVKYLLVDDEVHYSPITHDKMAFKWGITHKNFKITSIPRVNRYSHWGKLMPENFMSWSQLGASVFKVEALPGELTQQGLFDILSVISNGNYSIAEPHHEAY